MIKVPAYALQPGDVVGSGEVVEQVIASSTRWPSNKVKVMTNKRSILWGKHTMIGVKREGVI